MSTKTQPTTGKSPTTIARNVYALSRTSLPSSSRAARSRTPVTHIRAAREAREFGAASGVDAELLRRSVERFGKPAVRALRELARTLVELQPADPHAVLVICASASSMPVLWLRVGHAFITAFAGAKGGAA